MADFDNDADFDGGVDDDSDRDLRGECRSSFMFDAEAAAPSEMRQALDSALHLAKHAFGQSGGGAGADQARAGANEQARRLLLRASSNNEAEDDGQSSHSHNHTNTNTRGSDNYDGDDDNQYFDDASLDSVSVYEDALSSIDAFARRDQHQPPRSALSTTAGAAGPSTSATATTRRAAEETSDYTSRLRTQYNSYLAEQELERQQRLQQSRIAQQTGADESLDLTSLPEHQQHSDDHAAEVREPTPTADDATSMTENTHYNYIGDGIDSGSEADASRSGSSFSAVSLSATVTDSRRQLQQQSTVARQSSVADSENGDGERWDKLPLSVRSLPEPPGVLASIYARVANAFGYPQRMDSYLGAEEDISDFENVNQTLTRKLDILMLTIGSRGDIQPFLCYAISLQKRGHRVRLAGFSVFRSFIESFGVEFYPLAGDPKDLMQFCVENGMFTFSFIYEGIRNFRSFYAALLDSCWSACSAPRADGSPFSPDLILSNPPVLAHCHLAEALRIPYMIVFTMPWSPTGQFPQPMVADRGFGGELYNRWTFSLLEQLQWAGLSRVVNKWRVNRLGLRPTGSKAHEVQRQLHIYCYSRELLPQPDDWESHLCVTNFWFLDESQSNNWQPPEDLVAFLNSGEKPIYIGFGSVPSSDPDGLTALIVQAARTANVRLIVAKGWGGINNRAVDPDRIFFLDQCPHDWLFPQMAAVIHHGGAGTLAAGLRAGKPTGVVAFFGDQYFWGPKVQERGLGCWTPSSKLTEEWLVMAFGKLLEPSVQIAAQEVGEKINSTDGLREACDILERHMSTIETTLDSIEESHIETHTRTNETCDWVPDAASVANAAIREHPAPMRHGWEWTAPWKSDNWIYGKSMQAGLHPDQAETDALVRQRVWRRTRVRSTAGASE
eukprot:m.205849 g.205849  ORF g.205849 m.205849 type:complete len:897 (+) comp17768_c0_seq2:120-2810(+)